MAKKVPWKHVRVSHIHEASIVTIIVTQRFFGNLFTSVTIVVTVRDSADVSVFY